MESHRESLFQVFQRHFKVLEDNVCPFVLVVGGQLPVGQTANVCIVAYQDYGDVIAEGYRAFRCDILSGWGNWDVFSFRSQKMQRSKRTFVQA